MSAARAIWKGHLALGEYRAPVKMYAAVEPRTVHFRLLHAEDLAPVEQHIVRKEDGREVPKDEQRKAFALSGDTAIILHPEDLQALEPEPSRDIELCRFVPRTLLGDQWYDRPYWLGPDEDEAAYFALAEALEGQETVGIARWVMRKKRYVGALDVLDGYLMMTTLRRADQVLSFSGIEPGKAATPEANELQLAQQLVATIEGDFEPQRWRDEHRDRLYALIEAKSRGEQIAPPARKRKPKPASLVEGLRASLTAAREQRLA